MTPPGSASTGWLQPASENASGLSGVRRRQPEKLNQTVWAVYGLELTRHLVPFRSTKYQDLEDDTILEVNLRRGMDSVWARRCAYLLQRSREGP